MSASGVAVQQVVEDTYQCDNCFHGDWCDFHESLFQAKFDAFWNYLEARWGA